MVYRHYRPRQQLTNKMLCTQHQRSLNRLHMKNRKAAEASETKPAAAEVAAGSKAAAEKPENE